MTIWTDAETDAEDLAELVNGTGFVTTRYGDNPKRTWQQLQDEFDATQAGQYVAISVDAAERAETAADAAAISGNVYADTTAGLAATSAGDYFSVVSPTAENYLDLYKNDGGTAVLQKSYPSTEMVDDITRSISRSDVIATTAPQNIWITDAGEVISEGRHSWLYPVKAGDKFTVTTDGEKDTVIVQQVKESSVQVGDTVGSLGLREYITTGASLDVTIGEGVNFLWVSKTLASEDDRAPKSISNNTYQFLYRTDATDLKGNIITDSSGKTLALEAARGMDNAIANVSLDLKGFREISEEKDGVTYRIGSFQVNSNIQEAANPQHSTYELSLNVGDELKFDYTETAFTVLWHWGVKVTDKYPILTGKSNSGDIKSYNYVAKKGQTIRVTGAIIDTLKVNDAAPSYVDIGLWSAYSTESRDGNPNYRNVSSFSVKDGDTVVITNVKAGSAPILQNLTDGSHEKFAVMTYLTDDEDDGYFEWTFEKDTRAALCGSSETKFYIKERNEYIKDNFNDTIKAVAGSSELGDTLDLGETDNIFLSTRNYMVKTQLINGVDHILTSVDLGETWVQTENVVGKIVQAHIFSDGTMLLANNTKAYWTTDYITLNESSIFDENGDPLELTGDHMYSQKSGDRVVYVDGVEMHVFGDYTFGSPCYVWYTADRGRTIKAAAKFGTTPMGGEVRNVRHVHKVGFNQYDNKFYVTTGDHDTGGVFGGECMIVIGSYDTTNDAWQWEYTTNGADFKWNNIWFDRFYTYLVADITESSLADKNGIYRVPTSLLSDKSKLEHLWSPPLDELGSAATARIFKDNNGNILVSPDYAGSGRAWVSIDGGLKFKQVTVTPYLYLSTSTGVNYNGDIYVHAITQAGVINFDLRKLNKPTYNLTQAMRNLGVYNFMKGTNIFNNEIYYAD